MQGSLMLRCSLNKTPHDFWASLGLALTFLFLTCYDMVPKAASRTSDYIDVCRDVPYGVRTCMMLQS